ncbi:hypothetical protein N431DRAFT_428428 [Stipitochalara longipes BDJ]|nr:hypothetical protein N431DRAFT_428428 [Stipitochalara longipes BDJ]
MAIVTCLRGVNKIKKDTDEVVLYVSAIGSLFGLAIVVLCQGGEVGFWGWIAGVGWPVVALTTAVGLTTIMAFPRGSGFGSGSSEQERMARAAEQRKIAQQQEQQRAMVNYRILYEQPMTSQRKIELCDGVVSQSAVPLKDGNIVKHKKDTAMQFAAAGKQLGIATMEMDFEQMEGGKKMNTAFMQVQAVIKKKEAALSDSDSWVDLKRSKGGKSE